MKRVFGISLGFIVILFAILVYRAENLPSPYIDAPEVSGHDYDDNSIARHMSEAVQIRTISWSPTAPTEGEAFLEFHNWLEKTYPAVHANISKEVINNYSLLYKWQGKDPSLEPIALLGHMDVVPIEKGTEATWDYPPFSGEIAEGFIWGRGSLDDKSTVVLLMEAMEKLVSKGFQPDRDIYIAYGHDEEILGKNGAIKIVETLQSRDIHLKWIMDEGFPILEGFYNWMDKPTAIVGMAEKGFLTLELTATDAGGHSSSPRPQTSVSRLATAVSKVQNNQFPIDIGADGRTRLEAIAKDMPFLRRILIANLWLFAPVLEMEFANNPFMAAQFHTTTAATVFNAGQKENILPQEAKALINFRIHPRDNIDAIVERTRKTIDDESITIAFHSTPNNPPKSSDLNGEAYALIVEALGESFGPIAASPSLVIGATDSRFYKDITDETFRHTPVIITIEQFSGFHGTNERLGVEGLGNSVAFYDALIRKGGAK
jgi:carboxypeptidase PM20D1